MSDTNVQISNTSSVRPVSANYNVSVPQPVRMPDVNINIEQPDWAGLISKGVTAWAKGNAANEKAQLKAEADAAKTAAKNDLARKALLIQERQRQGGSRSEAATAFRALQDAALSEKILDEGEVYNTIKHYDGGLLGIDEDREKFWAKKNEEHLSNKVASLQQSNPQLNTMNPETVSSLLVNMQSQVDAATKLKSYMDTMPNGDAKERVKAQYSSYLQQNVYANVGIKIGNLYASGTAGSAGDYYKLQEDAITFCKQNGLTDGESAALTKTVFDMYGLGNGYERYNKYVKDNTEFYKGVNEMMLTRAKNNVLTSIDDAAYQFALGGQAFQEKYAIAANADITALAQKVKELPKIGADGKYTNTSIQTPSKDQVTAAVQGMSNVATNGTVPPKIAAGVLGTGLEMFNKSNMLQSGASEKDAVIAVQNSDGLRSLVNIDLVQKRADLLERSEDPEDQMYGLYIEQQAEEFTINDVTARLLEKYGNRLNKDSLAAGMYYFDNRSGRVSMRNSKEAGVMQKIGLAAAGLGATSDFKVMDDFNNTLKGQTYRGKPLSLEQKQKIAERCGFVVDTEDTNAPVSEDNATFDLVQDLSPAGYIARRALSGVEVDEATKERNRAVIGDIISGIEKTNIGTMAAREVANKIPVDKLKEFLGKAAKGAQKLMPGADLSKEQQKPVTASASSHTTDTLANASVQYPKLAFEDINWDDDMLMYTEAMEQIESAGKADAVSKKGARGLMQLMPETYKEMAKKYNLPLNAIDDPEFNKIAGTLYLQEMRDKYNGDMEKAVAAYNWGPGNVDKVISKYAYNWRQHLPLETKNHIKRFFRVLSEGAW